MNRRKSSMLCNQVIIDLNSQRDITYPFSDLKYGKGQHYLYILKNIKEVISTNYQNPHLVLIISLILLKRGEILDNFKNRRYQSCNMVLYYLRPLKP